MTQHFEVNSKHQEDGDDDSDPLSAVRWKEEGEQNDYHLYDTGNDDTVHVVERFTVKVHCVCDVHVLVGTAFVLGVTTFPIDAEEIPFGGVDVVGCDDWTFV